MQMEKHREVAFLLYFVILLLVVTIGMFSHINIVNIVYLVVILSCFLKFILIVNENKK